jgi:hypothetical protein
MDYKVKLQEITEPYRLTPSTCLGGPLYDYGVCGVLEDFLYESMDQGEFSASFNYLDFSCDGECVQGCMTITIMKYDFLPEVFTFLYERSLNTNGQ